MLHTEQSPLAGKEVKIKENIKHFQVPNFGGSLLRVEDWWDRVSGQSWGSCQANPACLVYATRTGFSETPVPFDDEVVYGKIGSFGHLVHISELELPK